MISLIPWQLSVSTNPLHDTLCKDLRKHRWHGIPDQHALLLARTNEAKCVWERLDACRLSDGEGPMQPRVNGEGVVAGNHRICRSCSIKPPVDVTKVTHVVS